jgi:hypothetical protein
MPPYHRRFCRQAAAGASADLPRKSLFVHLVLPIPTGPRPACTKVRKENPGRGRRRVRRRLPARPASPAGSRGCRPRRSAGGRQPTPGHATTLGEKRDRPGSAEVRRGAWPRKAPSTSGCWIRRSTRPLPAALRQLNLHTAQK